VDSTRGQSAQLGDFALGRYGSNNRAAAANEMPQNRDDGDHQKEVNQASSYMEDAETEEPGHDENDCQREEHEEFLDEILSRPPMRRPLGSETNCTGCARSVESIVRLDSGLVRKDYFAARRTELVRLDAPVIAGIAPLHEKAATSNQWLPVSFANTSWTRLSAVRSAIRNRAAISLLLKP
jgi:hypothetical protein